MTSRERKIRNPRIYVLSFILLLIALFYLTGTHRHITLENIQQHLDFLKELNSTRPLYFFSLFFGVMFVLISLSIPGTIVLTLLSGTIFGAVKGTLLVLTVASLGAGVSFLMSRYLFRKYLHEKFGHHFQEVEKKFQERGTSYLFTMRLIPVSPFVFINLFMGLTEIKLWTYLWVTFLGMAPGTFIYVLAGKEIATIESPSEILTPRIIVLLTVLGFFPVILRKILSLLHTSVET